MCGFVAGGFEVVELGAVFVEEEVSLQEFAKFEEKLKAQKGEAPASTVGKDSLDTVPG